MRRMPIRIKKDFKDKTFFCINDVNEKMYDGRVFKSREIAKKYMHEFYKLRECKMKKNKNGVSVIVRS